MGLRHQVRVLPTDDRLAATAGNGGRSGPRRPPGRRVPIAVCAAAGSPAPAPSPSARRWPMSALPRDCGCTSMRPTAASPRSPPRAGRCSQASSEPTPSPSTRTSGYSSRSNRRRPGRDGARLARTFAIHPDYLDLDSTGTHATGGVNLGDWGLQLSRGFHALKVWMSVQAFGLAAFRAAIDRDASWNWPPTPSTWSRASASWPSWHQRRWASVCFRREWPGCRRGRDRTPRDRARRRPGTAGMASCPPPAWPAGTPSGCAS